MKKFFRWIASFFKKGTTTVVTTHNQTCTPKESISEDKNESPIEDNSIDLNDYAVGFDPIEDDELTVEEPISNPTSNTNEDDVIINKANTFVPHLDIVLDRIEDEKPVDIIETIEEEKVEEPLILTLNEPVLVQKEVVAVDRNDLSSTGDLEERNEETNELENNSDELEILTKNDSEVILKSVKRPRGASNKYLVKNNKDLSFVEFTNHFKVAKYIKTHHVTLNKKLQTIVMTLNDDNSIQGEITIGDFTIVKMYV